MYVVKFDGDKQENVNVNNYILYGRYLGLERKLFIAISFVNLFSMFWNNE